MELESNVRPNRKGSLSRTFLLLVLFLMLYMGARWLVAEPFIIPSGSMLPNLFIRDHILVTKFDYGLRLPFTTKWIVGPLTPERGDVVVFVSKKDKGMFMVKRVVGLPGDTIELDEKGRLYINGEVDLQEEDLEAPLDWTSEDLEAKISSLTFQKESLGRHTFITMKKRDLPRVKYKAVVSSGHVFVIGDNRDSSMDSRFWGELPLQNLRGKAHLIWLSCEASIPNTPFICDFSTIRWQRVLKWINP